MRNKRDKESRPKLTEKQKQFCLEYLVDLNATQAAIRAGYSQRTAREIGKENLTKPYIQENIQKLIDKRSERTQITADYVLCELKRIAETDNVKDSNKIRALELLGKHPKLFTERHEHLGERGGPIPITVIKEYATPKHMDDKTENPLSS